MKDHKMQKCARLLVSNCPYCLTNRSCSNLHTFVTTTGRIFPFIFQRKATHSHVNFPSWKICSPESCKSNTRIAGWRGEALFFSALNKPVSFPVKVSHIFLKTFQPHFLYASKDEPENIQGSSKRVISNLFKNFIIE